MNRMNADCDSRILSLKVYPVYEELYSTSTTAFARAMYFYCSRTMPKLKEQGTHAEKTTR